MAFSPTEFKKNLNESVNDYLLKLNIFISVNDKLISENNLNENTKTAFEDFFKQVLSSKAKVERLLKETESLAGIRIDMPLVGLNLEGVNFHNVTFSGQNFDLSRSFPALFNDRVSPGIYCCNLNNANFSGAIINNYNIEGLKLSPFNSLLFKRYFKIFQPKESIPTLVSSFQDADFSGAFFRESNIENNIFKDCDFTRCGFTKCLFTNNSITYEDSSLCSKPPSFSECNLRENTIRYPKDFDCSQSDNIFERISDNSELFSFDLDWTADGFNEFFNKLSNLTSVQKFTAKLPPADSFSEQVYNDIVLNSEICEKYYSLPQIDIFNSVSAVSQALDKIDGKTSSESLQSVLNACDNKNNKTSIKFDKDGNYSYVKGVTVDVKLPRQKVEPVMSKIPTATSKIPIHKKR